jgi:hypothetical protein
MLLFDRDQFAEHRLWLVVTLLLSLAATGWAVGYAVWWGGWRWPGGGSVPGFTFGAVGGLVIVFEMLFWPRKVLWRGRRYLIRLLRIPMGSARTWMKAHIWLGLLTLPLLLLHGGLRLDPRGATLAVVLTWLLIGVVASGVYGLVQQNRLPRLLLDEVPDETIHAQIANVLDQYRMEARQLVEATCGQAGGPDEGGEGASYLVLTASTRNSLTRGKVVRTVPAEPVPDSDALRAFYQAYVEPYLRADARRAARLVLARPARADEMFRLMKAGLPAAAHRAADRLAELCSQRRQFDKQDQLHRKLHQWLAFHFALSWAMFLLMMVHAVLALRYL